SESADPILNDLAKRFLNRKPLKSATFSGNRDSKLVQELTLLVTLGQTTAQEITQILADSMDWKPATIKTLLGRLVKKEVIWTEQ
ncbi:BlaI/MecI/CopY family transcriptional regulator, partial [Enterococcus faecium]|uniref:BlaI/MecI/CopY family transcriptional regulator n=1 Tax=Enterococcus faecium TaxID=1352 RepID=UPI00292F808C